MKKILLTEKERDVLELAFDVMSQKIFVADVDEELIKAFNLTKKILKATHDKED